MSRRRPPPEPAPPGCIDVATVAVVCSDRGEHPRAHLYDLIDGRGIGQGETVLWQGKSPEKSFAGRAPVYRFACPRCGRDVPLRLPSLLAVIDAANSRPSRLVRPVVDISTLPVVLQ